MPHLYIHWVSLLWWRYLGIPRWMECERQSVCPHLGNLMALCDVNYLTLDIFTVWLPPLYVPMAFVTWIVLNVTYVLLPLDLMPAFYRWSYALPAN